MRENTVFNINTPVKGQKRKVTQLHIQLEDWLGDDLIVCYPCYVVTEKLKNALLISNYNGYEIDNLELTKDDYFSNNYNLKKPLESFYWLKVKGNKNVNDIFVDDNSQLNISQSLLALKKKIFDPVFGY